MAQLSIAEPATCDDELPTRLYCAPRLYRASRHAADSRGAPSNNLVRGAALLLFIEAWCFTFRGLVVFYEGTAIAPLWILGVAVASSPIIIALMCQALASDSGRPFSHVLFALSCDLAIGFIPGASVWLFARAARGEVGVIALQRIDGHTTVGARAITSRRWGPWIAALHATVCAAWLVVLLLVIGRLA